MVFGGRPVSHTSWRVFPQGVHLCTLEIVEDSLGRVHNFA